MRDKDGAAKFAAAAMSNPEVDFMNQILKPDPDVVINLIMSSQRRGLATSYNVIVTVGSGTSAIDDGSAVAIVTATGKLIQEHPKNPASTIRIVLYAAEELGLVGGKAYAKAHKHELEKHYIAAESDSDAERIYQTDHKVSESALEAIHAFGSPMVGMGLN